MSLNWNANPETDIAGYLLYRNGRLANASGVVIGPLTPYRISRLDYQDGSLQDGGYTYTLIAVDLAGNQSLPSAERAVEIDTRAPRASIVVPAMGVSFEAPLTVVAESEDQDIASIQLQYRPVGTDLWQGFGMLLKSEPYAASLDPDLLSLSFGELELRAVATDRGGHVDPDPVVTRIEYRDMAPPVAPAGLTVSFDCDEVTLLWSDNAEADLAGYNVYRKYDNGYLSLQNSQLLQAPAWIQAFGEGAYVFVVKAVDLNGNESLSSEAVSIQLKTPAWISADELTIESQLDLSGSNANPNARVLLLSNGATVFETLVDDIEAFSFEGVSLVRGENDFSAVAIDSEGNRSCISDSLLITKTILLPPPEGLRDLVTGHDVQLSWLPVIDPELNQYYVYRNGNRLKLPTQLVSAYLTTASADSSLNASSSAAMTIDGNYNTSWLSSYRIGVNKWLQIDFDQPRRVKSLYLEWVNSFWRGVNFELQVWDGNSWQTVSLIEGNVFIDNFIYLESAYLTKKVRLYITSFGNPYDYAGVREVKVYEEPVVDSPIYNDKVYGDGQYNYQVASVNSYGMEGPMSPIYSVGVGDVFPPLPPIHLTVTAPPQGKSLLLAWEAGSPDTDHFTVYRADNSGGPYEMVGRTRWDRLSTIDKGLTNGALYYYVVTASDQFDNESVNSLESFGTPLDILPPEAPSLFYPTVPGLDKLVYQETTAIRGLTEPGATVKLFAEGFQILETVSLSVPETNPLQYDFSGMDALMSPEGDFLLYLDDDRYDDGLVLRDLAAKTEVLIAERVEYYVWSRDGQRLTYTYDDLSFNDFVAFYVIETGEQTTFTTDLDVDIDYLSSSANGGIVAFVSDIGGDDDVWVKDLRAGTITQLSFGLDAETTAMSPDGTKVAYYDDYDEILYVADLASGETVEVDFDPYWRHFEWSPDSRYLAYLSYSNSNKDIYIYDSMSSKSDQITDIFTYKYDLHWAPDGKSIIYEQSSDDSVRLHFLSGEEYTLASDLIDLATLQWLSTGEIIFINNDSNLVDYLLPPGSFTFNDAPLHAGENQFYANATDRLERLSPTSDSILVIYDTSRMPDIAVAEDDIFIVPSVPAPGEQVMANILVRNYTEEAAQNVKVDLYLWDSQTTLEFLESRTLTQLDGEGTATLSFSFTAPDSPGSSSLLVVADPENVINELIESNNFANREFQVTADGGVQMAMALSREIVSSQQDLEIELNLLNNGQTVDGRIEVKILDQAGHLVELLSQTETRLKYGSEQLAYVWNARVVFAGEYRVWSGLYDDLGQLLAEQHQPFRILPDRRVDLSLRSDRSSYGANEAVLFEIDLLNSGLNDILTDLQLKTVITDAVGQQLFLDNQPVSQLLPGMSGRFSAVWNTGRHAPGDLNVVSEVWLEDEILQSATGSLKIYPVSRVTGDLRVEPQAVVYGFDFKLPFSIANSGNQAAVGQLRLELFDPESLGVVTTTEQEMTISVAGDLTGEFSLSSAGLKLQTYRARFFYVIGAQVQLISEESFKVIDGRAPELEVKSPLANEIYRQLVDFEVVAQDDISGVASLSYRMDGGAWQLLPFADLAAGRYAMTWHPALKDNGGHSIEFSALDNAGNIASSGPITFELQMDITPPVTRLETGLPYYKNPGGTEYLTGISVLKLLATDDISGVALTEYCIDSGAWTAYTDAISLVELSDAAHFVGFRSIDVLGNVETENLYNFVIDNTSPAITIVRPLVGKFYNYEVLPQVEINDLLPTENQSVLFFNGAEINNISPISDEGEYRLDITAVDSLGNVGTASVCFTIDKTLPVITASGFSDGAYYDADVIPQLLVADINLANSRIQLNGSDYVSGSVVNAEGQYELTASASDLAGNTVAVSWSFVVDKTSPESRLEFGLPNYQASGSLFVSPQTQFSLTSVDYGLVPAGIESITYAFAPNAAWNNYVDVFSLTILSEGDQDIHYRASDRAGNLEVSRSLSVVLDSSAPATEISTSGASFTDADGTLFVSAATSFELDAADSLSGVAHTAYRLDAGVWTEYAAFSLTGLADCAHSVDFRSRDNLNNLEPEQSLYVVVDNSPPVTSIAFNNQSYMNGDQLLVSRQTEISLTAVDSLTGVADILFRFDDQPGWQSYSDIFPLDTLDFGGHAIHFRSVDHLMNMESESSAEFVLIGVESNTSIVNVPRVLVWLGEEDKEHKDDNCHEDDKDHRDQDAKDDRDRDDEDREHEPKIDRSRQDALAFLAEALAGQDVYSQVVSSEAEYRSAFRSGVFNLTLILNEKLPFGGYFVHEFVEGIRRGMGLLIAPGKHAGESRLEALLGVKFKGQESNKKDRLNLQLYTSPVSEEGEVGLVGSVLKTELAGGTLAALIPGETSEKAINRMTLRLPLELHDGDVVKASLSRRHGNSLEIIDEEWLTADGQEHHRVNRSSGNVYGDLSLKGHDEGVLDLRIVSSYGAFTGVYELDVSVIAHDNGVVVPLITSLVLDWGTKWSVGAPVGICRVREINNKSKRKSRDLPGVVLHQFGEGKTAFLAFDLFASAKTADRSTYLTLVQKVLTYLLPEQAVPKAASTELLKTTIKLSGSAMDLVAIEHLWSGLSYRPLFDHRQASLEYHLSYQGGDEARYRYFVQSDDRLGTFGKESEVRFYQDGIASTYESYPYSFDVEKDSERLLQDSIDWLDEMLLLSPTEAGPHDGHDNDEYHDNDEDHDKGHDRDDGQHKVGRDNNSRFGDLKEQLIKIDLMDKGDKKKLDKVITKVLHALLLFDELPVVSSEPRAWVNDYLRIMEVKYDLLYGYVKSQPGC